MALRTIITSPTTISLPPSITEHCVDQQIDTGDRTSSDSTSSKDASPTTPFHERPFAFSHSQGNEQFDKAIDDPTNSNWNEIPTHITDISANDQKTSQHHHRQSQKNQDLYQRSVTNLIPSTERNEHRMHTPSKKTTMPAAPTADSNCIGASITHKKGVYPCLWNRNDVSNQENQNGDTASISDSSSSIDCEDFPNPPSSTPSLIQRLTIKTNIPHQHGKTDKATMSPPNDSPYGCKNDVDRNLASSSTKINTTSRFAEVFDIRGTEFELDYNLNYRHHRTTSSSPPSHKMNTTSTTPKKDQHLGTPSSAHNVSSNGGQNTRIGNFISTIGRTVALSSPSVASSSSPSAESSIPSSITTSNSKKRTLSTSSGSKSIRGLIRSLSTTATNRYHPVSKHSPKKAQDGMTKGAQAVSATTTTTVMQNQHFLPIEEVCNENGTSLANSAASTDGQRRRKISSLLSNAILKIPTKRHTTKIVNMEPLSTPSAKKLARRTVIYVNPDSQLDMDDFLENIQQYYQHHESTSTCIASSEHYRFVKKLPPSPPLDKFTTSPRSSTSCSQSPSTVLSDTSSSRSSSNKQTKRKSSCFEGLELREMEDGTIEWGIVMEEGQRKSFYPLAMDQQPKLNDDKDRQTYFNVGDDKGSEDDQIEPREAWTVMDQQLEEKSPSSHLLMIPRRSPRRKPSNALLSMSSTSIANLPLDHGPGQNISIGEYNESSSATSASSSSSTTASSLSSSATEIYYADMTLPSLLQIVSQIPKNNDNSNYQI